MTIEFVPMQITHAYALAKDLREGDRLECEALGKTPKEILRRSYYQSIIKQTILVDGGVAACFGGTGSILGDTLHPWLLTSPRVEKAYLALTLAYRQVVKSMLEQYPRLENFCDSRYTQSLRLLKIVGFNVDEPAPFGDNGNLFCKFWATA